MKCDRCGDKCPECVVNNAPTLLERIQTMAREIATDYPNIEECDSIEQLWAIEQAYDGTNKACSDLNKLIDAMRQKLEMDDAAFEEFCKQHGPVV